MAVISSSNVSSGIDAGLKSSDILPPAALNSAAGQYPTSVDASGSGDTMPPTNINDVMQSISDVSALHLLSLPFARSLRSYLNLLLMLKTVLAGVTGPAVSAATFIPATITAVVNFTALATVIAIQIFTMCLFFHFLTPY